MKIGLNITTLDLKYLYLKLHLDKLACYNERL